MDNVMKKLLLVALLALAPSAAWAQCSGSFPANSYCGSQAGGPPGPVAVGSGPVIGPAGSTLGGLPTWAVTTGNRLQDANGTNINGSYGWTGAQSYTGTASITIANPAGFNMTAANPLPSIQDSSGTSSWAAYRATNGTDNGIYVGSNGTVNGIATGSSAHDGFVFVNNGASGRLDLGAGGVFSSYIYPSGCLIASTSPFDCGAGTVSASIFSGGNAANSSITVKSTNSGSPSGDVTNILGDTINFVALSAGSVAINFGSNAHGVPGLTLFNSSGAPQTWAPGAGGTPGNISFPAISGGGNDTVTMLAAVQTLTNKTISGSNNTLSNIANGSLTNSSITISGAVVSLGGSYAPARNQTIPTNPSGTTSTAAFVMAGLSNGVTRFTPTTSGNLHFVINGTAQNNTASDGCQVKIQYGTGNGPANGAAITGTTAGNTSGQLIQETTAAASLPFAVSAYATGLTLSTAYYYDLGFAALGGGTCSLLNITMVALEQ